MSCNIFIFSRQLKFLISSVQWSKWYKEPLSTYSVTSANWGGFTQTPWNRITTKVQIWFCYFWTSNQRQTKRRWWWWLPLGCWRRLNIREDKKEREVRRQVLDNIKRLKWYKIPKNEYLIAEVFDVLNCDCLIFKDLDRNFCFIPSATKDFCRTTLMVEINKN